MGLRLYTAGERVTLALDNVEGVTITCLAPDYQTGRELVKFGAKLLGDPSTLGQLPQLVKNHMGKIVRTIEGVDVAEGSTVDIETDKAERITDECMAKIMPLVQEIFGAVMTFVGLDENQTKNS